MELDFRRNPWVEGIPRPHDLLGRELYRLLALFGASPALASRRTDREGGCVYSWCLTQYEYEEVGRLLLSIAVLLRTEWDVAPFRMAARIGEDSREPKVGTLVPNLKKPRQRKPLLLRDSLNKILHSWVLNPDLRGGRRLGDGSLRPFVHLYGEHRGTEWKATLDIFKWAEGIFVVLY